MAALSVRGLSEAQLAYLKQEARRQGISVNRLVLQRLAGTAVLLISEELEELLALSDRIAVIFDGRIMGIVDTDRADISELGLMMTGTPQEKLPGAKAAAGVS